MMVSCGRYIQTDNCCQTLGAELARMGAKKAYLLLGGHAMESVLPRVTDGLDAARVAYAAAPFSGFSSRGNASRHAERLRESGCDVIVGIGGGKCMDTVKIASQLAGVRMGMIPTQAATCASCANVAVEYDENGVYVGAFFHDTPIQFVLADPTILAQAPTRFIAAGIVDSMAKYPELLFGDRGSERCDAVDDAALQAACAMAGQIWCLLAANGRAALADNAARRVTPALNSVLHTNLVVTGAVSGLARGSRQLAVAHAFYNHFTFLFPEQWRAYLHGEIVSTGLMLQLALNGAPPETFDTFAGITRDLGVPTTLRQLGVTPSAAVLDRICAEIVQRFPDFTPAQRKTLRNAAERIAV